MLAATVRLPQIGFDTREIVDDVETFLVAPNVRYLEAYAAPLLLNAGVHYQRETDEEWLTIPYILERGCGDCEDLASWLAAEDRVVRGIDSIVVLYRAGSHLLHAVTARPRGSPCCERWAPWILFRTRNYYILDPSRALGMGRETRRALPGKTADRRLVK